MLYRNIAHPGIIARFRRCRCTAYVLTVIAVGSSLASVGAQTTLDGFSKLMEDSKQGDPSAIDKLARSVNVWPSGIITDLAKWGDPGIAVLNRALDYVDPRISSTNPFYHSLRLFEAQITHNIIIGVLDERRDPSSIPYLIRALAVTQDARPEPYVRTVPLHGYVARKGLIKFGETALPALLEGAKAKNPYVRGNCIFSASVIMSSNGDPRWLELIKKGLADSGDTFHYGDEDTGGSAFVHDSAWDALIEIGRPAVPTLNQALRDRGSSVRAHAAEALGEIGSAAASTVPALAAALRDEDSQVRYKAAEALKKIGPAAAPAVPALTKALKDRDEIVRTFAAEALGEIGPAAAPAVPALREALKDASVSQFAAAAIERISSSGQSAR